MAGFSNARLVIPKKLLSTLQPVIQEARKAKMPLYLVGGCVRDLILQKPVLDIDVVLEGNVAKVIKQIATAYRSKITHHAAFLTYTLQLKNESHLDIATARTEQYPEPCMLPVVQPATLQEDLYRRDFSINAMALSLNESDTGHLWDPYNGLDDLKQKRLRVLHQQSFQDDATRIFRAARFAVRLNCDLEWRTSDWLHEAVDAQYPLRLSGARLREELLPFFRESLPGRALKKLDEWKALSFCLPGFSWESTHDLLFDRFIHRQTGGDVVLKNLLVLFHHESLSKVKGALAHMMFPSKLIGQIEQALLILRDVRDPQFSLKDLPPSVFKQLVPEVRAFLKEASGIRSKLFRKKLEQEFERYEFATPVLTGEDLMKMGYSAGPMYHKMLQSLRSARWEGKLRTRQEEIQFIQNHFPLQS